MAMPDETFLIGKFVWFGEFLYDCSHEQSIERESRTD